MGIYLLLLILPVTVAAVAPPPFASSQTTAAPPPYYPYSNVNAVGGFIFLVVLAASFITCVLCACICVCCCGYSGNTTHRTIPLHAYASAAAGRPRRLSLRGLDPAAINSFPLFIYSEIKNLRIGKGELSCAVCVSEFEDNERLRLLPKCDHAFHPECIDPWLASHSTCPICRANLSQGIESTQSKEECMSRPELSEVQNQNQISITVDENQRMDTDPRERVRTFPRPHSTGHSLVRLGEDCERYTLRLPEEVRRQVNWLDRGGRSDRWICMTPAFSSRTGSLRSAKVGVDEGDYVTSKSPFECLAGKSEPMPSRPPV